ncbi:MAG: MFS transporter [Candidatus Hermodarchaeota archaeon]
MQKDVGSNREFIPIIFLSILWAVGRSTIFSFLSYFGVVIGASPLEQGVLTSVRNLGSNAFQSFWGWLADLRSRKLVLFIGLLTLAGCTFILPFVETPLQLVVLSLILTTIGFAFIPAWNAFLGDYAKERTRGTFIGRINSIGTAVSIFTILIMGILMTVYEESLGLPFAQAKEAFFTPFLSATLFFVLGIIVLFFLVERYQSKRGMVKEESHISWKTLISRNPPFRRLLPIDSFFKFAMSTAWPIFPFVVLSVVDSWFMVSITWVSFNIPRALGQSYGGSLSDRYNRKIILWMSRMLYPTVPICYAIGLISGNPWVFVIAGFPGGLAFGAEETSLATYSLDCSTEDTKARYFSFLLTAEGIAAFAGSLVAGFIMDILLRITGITYKDAGFATILFIMLAVIAILRIISGLMHGFIYPNPLDFSLDLELALSTPKDGIKL